MNKRLFPSDFTWGTATAAYQIEGAGSEDGRTPCIWDMFAAIPGKVHGGHNGSVACDHYHRYPEDIALMGELGFQSYRFSVAWPRIVPEKGKLNEKGIDFYLRLLEQLHKNNIKPSVTMYHWDLPMWLYEQGGWLSRDTVAHFEEYADTLYRRLGDAVPMWITHNEPWCAAFLGYGMGVHAPGHEDWNEALTAAHHLLLSHGRAVQAYRAAGLQGQIGITLNLSHVDAASPSEEDQRAARTADGFTNRWFLDPVFRGGYPEDMMSRFADLGVTFEFIKPGDFTTISTPNDFVGINYYTRQLIRANPEDTAFGLAHVKGENPHTDMDWEVYPDGLYHLLRKVSGEYSDLPIYITENGAAYADELCDGSVNDGERVEYYRGHVEAAHRFIQEGGPLKGYYCWSFMDNYEWAYGYSKRFGIVHVAYETQIRTPKQSALWFKELIHSNALPAR
ncbi:GH1 family beta-glucosidase [Paenibacillus sp. S-38]|uniref:GH1 family beta-glucosidase n=1 Tax=Paenibacillus sp. S-38 TaxID=3416710 RepID=UPI003CEB7D6C